MARVIDFGVKKDGKFFYIWEMQDDEDNWHRYYDFNKTHREKQISKSLFPSLIGLLIARPFVWDDFIEELNPSNHKYLIPRTWSLEHAQTIQPSERPRLHHFFTVKQAFHKRSIPTRSVRDVILVPQKATHFDFGKNIFLELFDGDTDLRRYIALEDFLFFISRSDPFDRKLFKDVLTFVVDNQHLFRGGVRIPANKFPETIRQIINDLVLRNHVPQIQRGLDKKNIPGPALLSVEKFLTQKRRFRQPKSSKRKSRNRSRQQKKRKSQTHYFRQSCGCTKCKRRRRL